MANGINVGSAYYTIGVKDDEFKTGIKNAENVMSGFDKNTSVSINNFNKNVENSAKQVNQFGKVLKGALAFFGTRELIQLSDTYTNLNNKLKLVTKSEQDLIFTREKLVALANETRSDVEGTVELYAKLARSTKNLNIETADLELVTKGINQAFKISGASSEEASNAVRQLAQGLSAGTLRGDEFISVTEQGSRIAEVLADSLGVTTGELRELAGQGVLTSEVIIKAFKEQSTVLQSEFDQLTPTIADSLNILQNSFLNLIGVGNQYTEASQSIAKIVQDLAGVVDFLAENIDVLTVAIKALIALKLGSTLQNWQQGFLKSATSAGTFTKGAGAMTNSVSFLKGNISALWKVLKANPLGIVTAAMTALYSIAQKLNEEFEALSARQKEALADQQVRVLTEALDEYNKAVETGNIVEIAGSFSKARAVLDGIGIAVRAVTEDQKQQLLASISQSETLQTLYADRIKALKIIQKEELTTADILSSVGVTVNQTTEKFVSNFDNYKKASKSTKKESDDAINSLLDSFNNTYDQIEQKRIDDIDKAQKAFQKGQIDYETYQELMTDINDKASKERIKATLNEVAGVAGAFSSLASQVSEISSLQEQNELQRIENEKVRREEALLNAYNDQVSAIEQEVLTEDEKNARLKALDEKYARDQENLDADIEKQQRKAQRDAAEREKKLAIFQAALAIPEAASKAYNSLVGVPVVGPALAVAAAAAATALQLKKLQLIQQQPLPELAQGGLFTGPAIVGEAGNEFTVPTNGGSLAVPLTSTRGANAIEAFTDGLLASAEKKSGMMSGKASATTIVLNLDGDTILTRTFYDNLTNASRAREFLVSRDSIIEA